MISEVVTCRECGKAIVFIDTPAGKKMPCDARMHKICVCDKSESGGLYVTAKGVVVRGRTDMGIQGETGYMPHWLSCTARQRPVNKPKPQKQAAEKTAAAESPPAKRHRTPKLRENPEQETFFKIYREGDII